MHVVHIMTRLLRAGSEENVLLTSAGQISNGSTVTLMYGADSSETLADSIVPDARKVEIPSLVRPIRPMKDVRAFFEMRDALRKLRPDVVHTHQSKAGIIGRLAAAAADVPCVIHGVHILPFIGAGKIDGTIYLLAERLAARFTHGFVHVSQGMQDGCLENGIGLSRKHEIVNSGFEVERFRSAERLESLKGILGESGEPGKTVILAMLAALEPRKRHLEMLEALSEVFAAHRNAHLLLAGEGPLKDEISRKAAQFGIQDQIHLLGYRSDPERILAASDICLLASGQEGLPRSVLQYVASGKPTVLFELPGVNVVAKNEKNAFVIPSDDWSKYRDAVEQLVSDPALRKRMAAATRDIDISPWDWRSMGSKTDAFYLDVMKAGNRAFAEN